MRCLLVDDEPGIREGLATLLRRRGFEVHTAGDCAAAAKHLVDQEFDVVVTDWRLPDGVASTFAVESPVPVLAVSGHPEEVERSGAICEVMAKPVRPAQLLDRIAACVDTQADTEESAGDAISLARDVQAVLDDVVTQLPSDAEVQCHDDGTFVVLRAKVAGSMKPSIVPRGGDLRFINSGVDYELELRLCRDGRPDMSTPVVGIGDAWPPSGAFAIDCGGTDFEADAFSQWLSSVEERNARGGKICLLNVPERLESTTSVWETTHDMPMRDRVGPRLSAELTELWS